MSATGKSLSHKYARNYTKNLPIPGGGIAVIIRDGGRGQGVVSDGVGVVGGWVWATEANG